MIKRDRRAAKVAEERHARLLKLYRQMHDWTTEDDCRHRFVESLNDELAPDLRRILPCYHWYECTLCKLPTLLPGGPG